ncbi:MAG TPA: DUF3108 domain-containing protein [Anaeromyxobacter sp.]
MIAAALVWVALAAGPACGLPPLAAGERPWKTGETLTYDLDVLGVVKAGTFQLSVEPPMSGGEIVPLRARAKTTSSVASVKRFAAVALSWIDASTLLPERYRDEAEEDGVRKISDARIRPPGPELVIETQYGGKRSRASFPRAGAVLDGLSAIAYLRAARTAPGERFCFQLVANRRFWALEGSIAAKPEKVETAAGRFDTFRVDATMRRVDRPKDRGRPVHLWFTRDARRLPVAIVSEVDVGPVRAMLASVRGAR